VCIFRTSDVISVGVLIIAWIPSPAVTKELTMLANDASQ
jgi:hypothetical protein